VSHTANSEKTGKDGSVKDIGTRGERREALESEKERGKKEMSGLSAEGTVIRNMGWG
jgi:hypothetical protein